MSSSQILNFPEQNTAANSALRRLIEVFQATGLLYKTIATKVEDYNLRKLCFEQAKLRSSIVSELSDIEHIDDDTQHAIAEEAENLQQCYTQLEPDTDMVDQSYLHSNLVTAEQNCVKVLKRLLPRLKEARLKNALAGIVARMQITLDQLCKIRGNAAR